MGEMSLSPSTNPNAILPAAETPIVCSIGIPGPLEARQLVQAVERGGLVTLRQRRIVEDGIDKVLDRGAQDHNRLADVEQFACPLANDVNAQNQLRIAMK